MQTMALEDEAVDLVGKARRGMGLDLHALAQRSGLPMAALAQLSPTTAPEVWAAVAGVLGWHPAKLAALAAGRYPTPPMLPPEVEQLPATVGGTRVNAWLLRQGNEAVLIDAGADVAMVTAALARGGGEVGRLRAVWLTHEHPDHIAHASALGQSFGVPVYSHPGARLAATQPARPGEPLGLSGWRVQVFSSAGHSPWGVTYLCQLPSGPVAAVGDALFAGSVGGAPATAWARALREVREHLLTLPAETWLLPGHGPATTVAHERAHNPVWLS